VNPSWQLLIHLSLHANEQVARSMFTFAAFAGSWTFLNLTSRGLAGAFQVAVHPWNTGFLQI
jgi:hypothetical protein